MRFRRQQWDGYHSLAASTVAPGQVLGRVSSFVDVQKLLKPDCHLWVYFWVGWQGGGGAPLSPPWSLVGKNHLSWRPSQSFSSDFMSVYFPALNIFLFKACSLCLTPDQGPSPAQSLDQRERNMLMAWALGTFPPTESGLVISAKRYRLRGIISWNCYYFNTAKLL